MTKRLCQEKTPTHLDASLACRMILFDKKHGVRPVGIVKVLDVSWEKL